MSKEKKKKENAELEAISNVGVASSLSETVERYGSANKEHLVILDGVDNETGEQLKRSLKDISKYKINKDYVENNTKQQAGYSAELKEQARQNADNIIKGKSSKTIQYDNASKSQQAQVKEKFPEFNANSGNHELVDLIEVDKNGKVIDIVQMKIVGSDPQKCLDKLISKEYQKYFDLDGEIDVKIPKEHYEGVQKLISKKINMLNEQIEKAKDKPEILEKKVKELEKYKKIREKIKPSSVSSGEAIEARTNPTKSTLKDMAKISHRAGMEGAKIGAGVGGTISLVKNIVSIYKDDKNPKEALKDICVDTTKAGTLGYATSASGSFIKSFMQNSEGQVLRSASKTALPAMIVVACVEVTKSVTRYTKEEISGYELAEELGERGTGIGVSAMFATAMQFAIPIPVVGAMFGGMLGYTLNSFFYQETMNSLKEAKLARQRRIQIEQECEQMIKQIKSYRKEMNELLSKYFAENLSFFNDSFEKMQNALKSDDTDGFIESNLSIIEKLGGKVQFKNLAEFKKFQNSNEELEF